MIASTGYCCKCGQGAGGIRVVRLKILLRCDLVAICEMVNVVCVGRVGVVVVVGEITSTSFGCLCRDRGGGGGDGLG